MRALAEPGLEPGTLCSSSRRSTIGAIQPYTDAVNRTLFNGVAVQRLAIQHQGKRGLPNIKSFTKFIALINRAFASLLLLLLGVEPRTSIRPAGFEPTHSGWKPDSLPLTYGRVLSYGAILAYSITIVQLVYAVLFIPVVTTTLVAFTATEMFWFKVGLA